MSRDNQPTVLPMRLGRGYLRAGPLEPEYDGNAARDQRGFRLDSAYAPIYENAHQTHGGGRAARRSFSREYARANPSGIDSGGPVPAVIGLALNLFYGAGLRRPVSSSAAVAKPQSARKGSLN